MRYRIIIYRSRKLRDDFIPFDSAAPEDFFEEPEEESFSGDDEPEEKMTRAQRRAQRKEMKRQRRANAHLVEIGDKTVDPREYDPEDIEDMKASAEVNRDGFYDILEPIDIGEERDVQKMDRRKYLLLIPIVGVLAAIIFFGFRFVLR